MPDIRIIHAFNPDPDIIQHAGRVLRSGGVVCFPTSGLYGLGAKWNDEAAIRRIYAIKGRDRSKPILILIRHRLDIPDLVTNIPAVALRLMDRFWPGRLTLVFDASRRVPEILTAGSGKIGIRLPAHRVAQALVVETGAPITGTSANVSGEAGCSSISELAAEVRTSVDLVLDAGILAGGSGSTVVDVTTDPVRVLRWGAVSMDELKEVVERWHGQ
ncbi:MAG: L-threonylcarbamoyladenylate synthase [Thermodesulfobacteriota bacterium]